MEQKPSLETLVERARLEVLSEYARNYTLQCHIDPVTHERKVVAVKIDAQNNHMDQSRRIQAIMQNSRMQCEIDPKRMFACLF